MQHFVIIVCAPNLQHAKHTITFCFSLKMASVHGREVSCACSLTKLTELLRLAAQSTNTFFQAADGWWHLNVYGLYLRQCLFQKLIEFRQNSEYNGSPYFLSILLTSFHMFPTQSAKRIHSPCVFSKWMVSWKNAFHDGKGTHTYTKSLYHSLQDWITKMNNWL